MESRPSAVEKGPTLPTVEGLLQRRALSQNSADSDGHANTLEGQESPLNWAYLPRWMYTLIAVSASAVVAFTSSVHSPAIPAISQDFAVSMTVSTLGTTTFLLGSAFGPSVMAPLSEIWGRNPLYHSAYLLFFLANLGCALSPNIAALLCFRFVAGWFGVAVVANAGGTITDLWPITHRSVPFALFTAASFCGPVLGPVIGGFLVQYASWRWNYWLVTIMAGVIYVVMIVFLPETYAPRLLEVKAAKAGFHATRTDKSRRFGQTLLRPWAMLFTEPILFTLSLYMAFIFGVLYLDFTAYPTVFKTARGWSTGIAGLSFLGIGFGMVIGTALSPQVNRIYIHYKLKIGPVPEARLPHLIIIVWLLPVGLFWFGWTALPPTHWISSILAGIPFGFALVMLFLGINAYLTDCYERFGASALAANTTLRSLFGAGFPLFAANMYEKLGTPWATSVLGFVALAMGILPFVFYQYGARLRAVSKFHIAVTSGRD